MAAATAAPEFLHTPMSAPSPPRLADPKVEMLRSMFPEIETDVLEAMLQFHSGDVEAACSTILDTNSSQEDLDEAYARTLQSEMDEQVAKTVHKELQRDLEREAAERAQNDPALRAAAAVEKAAVSAAASAKSLLQRAVRPLSARGRSSSTHATRLLDSPADAAVDGPAFDFSPLQLGGYQPNYQSTAHPPSQAPQTPAAADASHPDLSAEGSERSSDRYSARLDRARSANLASQRSMGRIAVPSPLDGTATLAPLTAQAVPVAPAAPHVPEGELI